MGDLDNLLPPESLTRSTATGNEWVLTFRDAEDAIGIANAHFIAVLGIELIRILPDGLGVEDYSGYHNGHDERARYRLARLCEAK